MLQGQEIVRFGLYTADLHAFELKKGQATVPLQNLPFRILALLLCDPGRVVTREEIRKELWPADTFVDYERGISTGVGKLREALGDSAGNPRFIETVGRRGYRFIAPATMVPRESSGSPANGAVTSAAAAAAPAPSPVIKVSEAADFGPLPVSSSRRIRPILWAIASLCVVAIAATVIARWRSASRQPQIVSIAVLPLQNLSEDAEQDYLNDGLTDALTTRLAEIGDLRVISRTTAMHYKHTQKTTPEIARELGVDALLEGSLIRSGNRLRVNVQLIQTSNDQHLWANEYDRDLADVLTLEGDLAREIAGQIRSRLTPEQQERLARRTTRDPEAYALYLQGRYYWHQRSQESLTKAIGYFEQAIARDPDFASAYSGLADSYVVLQSFGPTSSPEAASRAAKYAERAIALDNNLADAHCSRAYVRLYKDWDFKGAEQEFRLALALNPNYATAHQWYSELLTMEGRYAEGIQEVEKALQLDSQSAVIHHEAAQTYNTARQYDRAILEYNKALELDPRLYVSYFGLYLAYRRKGDFDTAIHYGTMHASYLGQPYEKAFAEAVATYRRGGKEAFLHRSLLVWSKAPLWSAMIGQVWDYGALHDSEGTLRVLEREYKRHNICAVYALEPELDWMRSDPRLQAFVRKIGLPELR